VASGYTDQVAKAVLRRPGTLFVGEEYEVRAEGGGGIQASTHAFVVAAHSMTVTLAVSRARGGLEFEMVPNPNPNHNPNPNPKPNPSPNPNPDPDPNADPNPSPNHV